MPSYKPATRLFKAFEGLLNAMEAQGTSEITVSATDVKSWKKDAKLVDARTRLDGSAKNKPKKRGAR